MPWDFKNIKKTLKNICKRDAIDDSYMENRGLPTDKVQMRLGFNGVVGYVPNIKNQP